MIKLYIIKLTLHLFLEHRPDMIFFLLLRGLLKKPDSEFIIAGEIDE